MMVLASSTAAFLVVSKLATACVVEV